MYFIFAICFSIFILILSLWAMGAENWFKDKKYRYEIPEYIHEKPRSQHLLLDVLGCEYQGPIRCICTLPREQRCLKYSVNCPYDLLTKIHELRQEQA